jgi:S-adenosylmethionine hydrolase
VKVVESEEAAAVLDFPGSPTFHVNGRDIFESTAGPALSCRLYSTTTGPSGLPDLASLRRAIRDIKDT